MIPWRTAPHPLDLPAAFGREAPLTLEIGYGNGEFLTRSAAAHPDRDFLGIELEWHATRRALRRIGQQGLTNVRLIQADARLAVELCLPPACLDQVTILFPCPWPKARHARHRLFSASFLELLSNRLKPSGWAWIVTDFRPLFEEIQTNGGAAGMRVETSTVKAGLGTKYERRWQSEGQQDFYASRLVPRESRPAPPRIQEVPVHIHTLTEFPSDWSLPEGTFVEGTIRVQFRELVLDQERRKAMVRAFVVEDGVVQEFWIEVTPEEGYWKLRPAPGCALLPTRGVQVALDRIRSFWP
ncbi:MAG: tRNA (guanine(46)-N(7))-methyltransferase TrmB [Candidatus Eremiobacterota bacterium]